MRSLVCAMDARLTCAQFPVGRIHERRIDTGVIRPDCVLKVVAARIHDVIIIENEKLL